MKTLSEKALKDFSSIAEVYGIEYSEKDSVKHEITCVALNLSKTNANYIKRIFEIIVKPTLQIIISAFETLIISLFFFIACPFTIAYYLKKNKGFKIKGMYLCFKHRKEIKNIINSIQQKDKECK